MDQGAKEDNTGGGGATAADRACLRALKVIAADVDAAGMSVRELKAFLNARGVDHSKCIEKSEMRALVEAHAAAPAIVEAEKYMAMVAEHLAMEAKVPACTDRAQLRQRVVHEVSVDRGDRLHVTRDARPALRRERLALRIQQHARPRQSDAQLERLVLHRRLGQRAEERARRLQCGEAEAVEPGGALLLQPRRQAQQVRVGGADHDGE